MQHDDEIVLSYLWMKENERAEIDLVGSFGKFHCRVREGKAMDDDVRCEWRDFFSSGNGALEREGRHKRLWNTMIKEWSCPIGLNTLTVTEKVSVVE